MQKGYQNLRFTLESRIETKQCVTTEINENINSDPKMINKMHFNFNSVIDIFPFAINQNILSFLQR